LYLLVDEINPTFDENHLFFGVDIMYSFHDLVFLILEVMGSIVKESIEQMPYFRLITAIPQALYFVIALVAILDGLLQ
jgi:hypothetical protein